MCALDDGARESALSFVFSLAFPPTHLGIRHLVQEVSRGLAEYNNIHTNWSLRFYYRESPLLSLTLLACAFTVYICADETRPLVSRVDLNLD